MRKIRRKDREIETNDAINLLTKCEYGVLSTVGNDGQPYGVPLNYVYKDNCIYFHSARGGHKIENIENNSKVSFCAIGYTNVLPSKFGTEYESVVAFGNASEVIQDGNGSVYDPGIDDDKTPGFEIIIMIAATSIILFLKKKKIG